MVTDERAEAARLRYLGADTPDAIPWAELKERVKDTWLHYINQAWLGYQNCEARDNLRAALEGE